MALRWASESLVNPQRHLGALIRKTADWSLKQLKRLSLIAEKRLRGWGPMYSSLQDHRKDEAMSKRTTHQDSEMRTLGEQELEKIASGNTVAFGPDYIFGSDEYNEVVSTPSSPQQRQPLTGPLQRTRT